MMAYYVHDAHQDRDLLVIPDTRCAATVDARVMGQFIAPVPNFAAISGDAVATSTPEDFGTIIATREEAGDVCIRDTVLWPQRMARYLGRP